MKDTDKQKEKVAWCQKEIDRFNGKEKAEWKLVKQKQTRKSK